MTPAEKQQYCAGCYNDFYNRRGNSATCWSLNDAHVVARYRIGWWTAPDSISAFKEVITLDCHHAPGRYGDHKQLPEHLRAEGGRS